MAAGVVANIKAEKAFEYESVGAISKMDKINILVLRNGIILKF